MKQNSHFDVIIIGAGLAGLALACLLGRSGIRTACIEKHNLAVKPDDDLRTTAISYGSRLILEEAGIWDALSAEACPINDIEILDGDSPVLLDFSSREVEGKSFGWIVLNADLRGALLREAQTHKAVHFVTPAETSGFAADENSINVTLKDGRSYTASLLVGADGRTSWVRDEMDVPVRGWDYHQRAVICTVIHQNPHKNIAVEHFWPSGPFAILPMRDDAKNRHRSAVVFTEHGPARHSLMRLADADFETVLSSRFPARYGRVEIASARACYPLSLTHAGDYTGPRCALVADAAHAIHPIAGQGLNLGYRDVKALADLLKAAFKDGADMGAPSLLAEYQARRRLDNISMAAFTDILVRLFSNDSLPLRLLRRKGLKMIGKMPPAKRFFMRQAMGQRGFASRITGNE